MKSLWPKTGGLGSQATNQNMARQADFLMAPSK